MMRVLVFAPAAAALLLLGLVEATSDLHPVLRNVSLTFAGLSVLVGVLLGRNDLRLHAAVALAIASATASGQGKSGVVYGVGAVLFAMTIVLLLRAPEWFAVRASPIARSHAGTTTPTSAPRDLLRLALFGLGAFGVLTLGLPRLGRALEEPIGRFLLGRTPSETGFSTNMRLGAMRGMLLSDRIVMRVEGRPVDYLRGAVYDKYERRTWSSTRDEPRTTYPAKLAPERVDTRLVFARSFDAARGRGARYFLPFDADALRTSSSLVTVDPMGIAHPTNEDAAREIAFSLAERSSPDRGASPLPRTSNETNVPAAAVEPSPMDLSMSPPLRARLTTIAQSMTEGAGTDRAKLDAIVRSLSTFGYSLDVERDPQVEPVVDFLVVHREGHCELFASAMALLARTQDIPARVVTGYRVTEWNPLTGLAVVRERNAHAWVEAWLDGRWTTWDPTPVTDGPAMRSSMLTNLADLAAVLYDRVARRVEEVGLTTVLGSVAALLSAIFFGRRLLARWRTVDDETWSSSIEPPLECFAVLEAALANLGHLRGADEPIERFAARIAALDAPWAADAAAAITTYSALRYGGVGDETNVARHLVEISRRLA